MNLLRFFFFCGNITCEIVCHIGMYKEWNSHLVIHDVTTSYIECLDSSAYIVHTRSLREPHWHKEGQFASLTIFRGSFDATSNCFIQLHWHMIHQTLHIRISGNEELIIYRWNLLCTCVFINQSNSQCLTHCGGVMHICVSKLSIIGSDNGLSPGQRQAII